MRVAHTCCRPSIAVGDRTILPALPDGVKKKSSTKTAVWHPNWSAGRTADATPTQGGGGGEAINEFCATFMIARCAAYTKQEGQHTSRMRQIPRCTPPAADGRPAASIVSGGSNKAQPSCNETATNRQAN